MGWFGNAFFRKCAKGACVVMTDGRRPLQWRRLKKRWRKIDECYLMLDLEDLIVFIL